MRICLVAEKYSAKRRVFEELFARLLLLPGVFLDNQIFCFVYRDSLSLSAHILLFSPCVSDTEVARYKHIRIINLPVEEEALLDCAAVVVKFCKNLLDLIVCIIRPLEFSN